MKLFQVTLVIFEPVEHETIKKIKRSAGVFSVMEDSTEIKHCDSDNNQVLVVLNFPDASSLVYFLQDISYVIPDIIYSEFKVINLE
jgi:hypothetical protein